MLVIPYQTRLAVRSLPLVTLVLVAVNDHTGAALQPLAQFGFTITTPP